MPLGKIAPDAVRAILAGGASVCADAGVPLAGGHSIDSPEPIYGLVALGLVRPDRVRRNSGARDGDQLILTKGLGVGVISAALKQATLPVIAGNGQIMLWRFAMPHQTVVAPLYQVGGVMTQIAREVPGPGLRYQCAVRLE